ncbi:MAG: DUF1501 domain-containing protein [Pyrinomonadaceae bacterium]
MTHNRREFLRRSACGLTAAALAASIKDFGLIGALARQEQPDAADYKALVCIFMSGGNDGNNTVIPYDDYSAAGGYSVVRGSSQLAVPQANLLQISPPSQQGRKFGFHPNMTEMQSLFNQNKLAVLCNVGTLVQPLTKAIYQSGQGRPYQLFSHSDQVTQQQSSISNTPSQTGWGGRTSDAMNGVNGAAPLPMNVSIAGTNLFEKGADTRMLAIGDSNTPLSSVLALNDAPGSTAAEKTARNAAFDQIRGADNNFTLIKASSDVVSQALITRAALSTNPTINTVFPNTSIGRQLLQVSRLLSLRNTLGVSRQIFFCSLGGFDTHSNQTSTDLNGNQGNLLRQLSQAMNAFYNATVELQIATQVTAFTLSDFGRTFQPAGTGAGTVGSDHGWGNHQFILGGSVARGDFFGTYPTLALGGPDDTDTRGRWIPTTSIEQYGATLATWYGLSSADLSTVFPLLSRFPTSNLGFLS